MANVVSGSNVTLNVTLTDNNSVPLNLTDANVIMKLLGPTNSQTTVSASITNATSGFVTVNLSPSQISVSGTYTFEFSITFSDGTISTSSSSTLPVVPPIF